jgi:hypothetical protein
LDETNHVENAMEITNVLRGEDYKDISLGMLAPTRRGGNGRTK